MIKEIVTQRNLRSHYVSKIYGCHICRSITFPINQIRWHVWCDMAFIVAMLGNKPIVTNIRGITRLMGVIG